MRYPCLEDERPVILLYHHTVPLRYIQYTPLNHSYPVMHSPGLWQSVQRLCKSITVPTARPLMTASHSVIKTNLTSFEFVLSLWPYCYCHSRCYTVPINQSGTVAINYLITQGCASGKLLKLAAAGWPAKACFTAQLAARHSCMHLIYHEIGSTTWKLDAQVSFPCLESATVDNKSSVKSWYCSPSKSGSRRWTLPRPSSSTAVFWFTMLVKLFGKNSRSLLPS